MTVLELPRGVRPTDDEDGEGSPSTSWLPDSARDVLLGLATGLLSLLVVAYMMPGSVFQKIGPVEGRWFAPSIDLTVHLFDRPSPGWILGHNRARHAGDGYASVEIELWDPSGPLLAYATQVMFFTFVDGA